jgi:hypothetical protein
MYEVGNESMARLHTYAVALLKLIDNIAKNVLVKGLVVADLHQHELLKNWELLQVGKHNKIKPLV